MVVQRHRGLRGARDDQRLVQVGLPVGQPLEQLVVHHHHWDRHKSRVRSLLTSDAVRDTPPAQWPGTFVVLVLSGWYALTVLRRAVRVLGGVGGAVGVGARWDGREGLGEGRWSRSLRGETQLSSLRRVQAGAR